MRLEPILGGALMRRTLASLLLFPALLLAPACSPSAKEAIRPPAHAGGFYPADKDVIESFIKEALQKADVPSGVNPRAVICPHAGYQFSGPTAAFSYKALLGEASRIKRVILLAPSHYAGFEGVVLNACSYQTPLGVYPLDQEAVKKLKENRFAWTENEIASTQEHADEVQIPFLQMTLPQAKLVPLIVGDMGDAGYREAAQALATVVDDSTVIVISSDFTHYGPNYGYMPKFKKGVKQGLHDLDMGAVELIVKGDGEGFTRYVDETGATICGRNPIRLALELFKAMGWKADGKLMAYDTSGQITGDWTNSVSYTAIALGSLTKGEKTMLQQEKFLTDAEQKTLLRLARHVLEKFVKEGTSGYPDKDLAGFELTDNLKKPFGVFVTLNEDDNLRGCIGSIMPDAPLYQGVIDNAMNAAARDPRFRAVKPGELKAIKIEISVMSPLIPVQSLDEIVVGRDGLVLRAGGSGGVFLPQVPVEWHWDKQQYLEELGHKAGLDSNAYKRKDAKLWRFTAQVFGEE
jgi:hypothetical protein